MDDNPYESPAEIPLPELPKPAPKPSLAKRIKRITQFITFGCAVLFFLFQSRLLPAQDVIVLQTLFWAAMLGLVLVIACNYFDRPKLSHRVVPRRLRMK